MPTARFYNESAHGVTFWNGSPDQKITLTSFPYDWMEASFFYTSLKNIPYCGLDFDDVCKQDYKDKGFNFKLRIKQEGVMPAIAIGLSDLAGTGLYNSEYIVGSYGLNNFDFHFGLGWGIMNSPQDSLRNPLKYINESFETRPIGISKKGGQFEISRYFSGSMSPFYGISYVHNNNLLLKIERDTTTNNNGVVNFEVEEPSSKYSFGLSYVANDNFVIGLSYERGNYTSININYRNNPKNTYPKYKYIGAENNEEKDKYKKLINNLEKNGIGVNKIITATNSIGLELTQFTHPNIQLIEEIIYQASVDAGIKEEVKTNLKIVDMNVVKGFDDNYEKDNKIIYKRNKSSQFNTSTNIKFRPFIASREEFFKGALLLENDSEYLFSDNFSFYSNLKYSLANNFDDLRYPPLNTFPAQVRSDVKEYLKNMDEGILIGRAQFDYYLNPYKNQYLMLSAGILEDMFSGYGMEYLYHKSDSNYSFGFELFHVRKRDYDWGLGMLDYENITGHISFNYRNYGLLPFDMTVSYGEYLAGDVGGTIEFSRSYNNGMKFGVFASITDVSAEEFGEGSFDKGIFFNIPIYGNLINYTWRPLTKDPGAKLIRRNNLNNLLVKFRPIN